MDLTAFKASEKNKGYYKDALKLMAPDLTGAGGYDEIYILTPDDFRNVKSFDPNKADLNIPLLQQGQMMERLKESSPEHYAILKTLLTRYIDDPKAVVMARGDSSLAVKIGDGIDQPQMKVGFLFLSDSHDRQSTWNNLGPYGLSEGGQAELKRQSERDADDMQRFIVLPHEGGHLLEMLHGDHGMIDTSLPPSHIGELVAAKTTDSVREKEILADEYAEGIFHEAVNKGLVSNHSAFDQFMNFRMLRAVDAALFDPYQRSTHGTAPFMEGSDFRDDGGRQWFDQANRNISLKVRGALDKTMEDLVLQKNMGALGKPQTIWDASIQDCFGKASDESYQSRLDLGQNPMFRPMLKSAPLMSIRESFQNCVLGDFSNRYKLMTEQYQVSDVDGHESRLAYRYLLAAEADIPDTGRADMPLADQGAAMKAGEQRQQPQPKLAF